MAPITPALLDKLSLLATNAPRDPKDTRPITTGDELDRYIDGLVDDPRFAREVAPGMVLQNMPVRAGTNDLFGVLSVDGSGPVPVYYLREKCSPAQAVGVHPWWALDTTVKVCPDSYRPDRLKAPDTGLFCGFAPNPLCGCGPNLSLCVRDGAQRFSIVLSMRKEMLGLAGRVVAQDAPVDEVFLSNDTERDRNVEYVYRRWRISAGEPAEKVLAGLDAWPTTPVRAPRHETTPHQHAGVLTSAGALGFETGNRARLKWFYESMWCDEPPGGTVQTDAVLSLPKGNLRHGHGWERLAAMPVCTECHARLDYGARFFTGYSVGFAYDPKEHVTGQGKLFGRDIRDERGEGELTPRGFATLALAQREFPACMVKIVKRRVLVDAADGADDAALLRAFETGHSMKALMKTALRQYATHERARCDGATRTPDGGDGLGALMGRYCTTCHGPSRLPDLDTATDEATLKRALTLVAFGAMPRPPSTMPAQDRDRMIELLVRRIWADPAAQADARAYFAHARAMPVHTLKASLATVDRRAGAPPSALEAVPFRNALEGMTRADLLQYSPGFGALVHLEALRACKAAGHTGQALVDCVDQASKIEDTVRTGMER